MNGPVNAFPAGDYAVIFLDVNGNICKSSNTVESLKGYTAEELKGINFSIFFTEADINARLPQKLLDEAAQKGVVIYSGNRVRKDGSLFEADMILSACYNDTGKVRGFTKVVRDHSRMARQINFDNYNLNALINTTRDLMWSIDLDYRLITANTAFNNEVQKISGKKIERGESVLADTELAMRFKKYYDRALSGEAFTETLHASEPEEIWAEISFYPIKEHNAIVGTACFSRNITRRKLAEQQLLITKRLYRFLGEINHAILYADNEQALFNEVCRIAVTTGNFELACIDRLDEANRMLHLAAQYNADASAVELYSSISYSEDGPVTQIIRTGKYHVVDNLLKEPEQSFWKQYAFTRDFRSAIGLPIHKSGKITFILALFSKKSKAFKAGDIELLQKAAENISFTLEVFENEQLRRQAEATLLQKEQRLRHTQEVAHVGSWELDFSTGIAAWSDEHCRIFGLPLENNKHTFESWLSFVHPDDRQHATRMSQQGKEQLKDFSFHHRIIRPDGTIRYIYSQNHFEFADGQPQSLFGASYDITDIKAAEEKIIHSEYRLKQAQSAAHFGSWYLDFADGNATWSEEACRIYGLTPEDNKHSYEEWLSFVHPEDLPYVLSVIENSRAKQSNLDFYHRITRKDGVIRHLHSITNYEFDSFGKPVGLYGVLHDITGQRNNIIQLKAQNEQLREIAWIQSHKVRGPLATILGLAQLFKNKETDQTKEIIEGIIESSEELDKVIHEIVKNTGASHIDNTFPNAPDNFWKDAAQS